MLKNLIFDRKSSKPLNLQIADAIMCQIEKGILQEGTALPSINDFNEKFSVARDTVERSYKELKKRGYIFSVKGKGYFIISAKQKKIKVLFIFNKISNFKKIIYYSFINTLADIATVDIEIHHYNPFLLNDIITKNLGKYNYYVVMPHFEANSNLGECEKIVQRIPKEELVLLDKFLPEIACDKAVFQDFQNDIYNILNESKIELKKYNNIVLHFPIDSNHPEEITSGVKAFCKETNKSFKIALIDNKISLMKGTLFIVISDDDLVTLIRQLKLSTFKIGKDIGIISFNETELKSLLDITVVTTDFEQMGITAADMIAKGKNAIVKNPFHMIKRGSI